MIPDSLRTTWPDTRTWIKSWVEHEGYLIAHLDQRNGFCCAVRRRVMTLYMLESMSLRFQRGCLLPTQDASCAPYQLQLPTGFISDSSFQFHLRHPIQIRNTFASSSLMDETIKDSDNRSLKLIIPRFYIIIMCWLEHYKHYDQIVDKYYAALSFR